ncbi:MAG: hypothetical protein WA667_03130 [Candidatus Nitrosopolaris sp.]
MDQLIFLLTARICYSTPIVMDSLAATQVTTETPCKNRERKSVTIQNLAISWSQRNGTPDYMRMTIVIVIE